MLTEVVAALTSLANSKVVETVAPAIVSSIFGALTALAVFWLKSREPLAGAIAWRWCHDLFSGPSDQPFLVIQNRSSVPAFIKRARLLKGNFLKREARIYAFSYDEPEDGNFPLEIRAQTVTMFPLSQYQADDTFAQARWFNKAIGYLFKRPFLWIELITISGRRVVIPANDLASFKDRPLWIDLRWLPSS